MFGTKQRRTVAVVSVGSASLSVGIGEYDGASASLLVSEQKSLTLEQRSPEQTIVALKQMLQEIATKVTSEFLLKHKSSSITALYCVIRAPWTKSTVASAEASFKGEERITDKMISELARQALSSVGDSKDVLDASVSQITLNGYPTRRPEGKRAHHIRVTGLAASCDPQLKAAVIEALRAAFPSHTPLFRSGTRASVEAVQLIHPTIDDCLILDVSAEGTAAVVVRRGSTDSELYIPEGIRTILDRVSSTATAEEARQALRLMARDECSLESCAKIEAGLAQMAPELAHVFGESLVKVSAPKKLPTTLVLITSTDMTSWLGLFFARIDFTQFTLTAQPFDVVVLSPIDLMRGSMTTVSLNTDVDLALALALINKETQAN